MITLKKSVLSTITLYVPRPLAWFPNIDFTVDLTARRKLNELF